MAVTTRSRAKTPKQAQHSTPSTKTGKATKKATVGTSKKPASVPKKTKKQQSPKLKSSLKMSKPWTSSGTTPPLPPTAGMGKPIALAHKKEAKNAAAGKAERAARQAAIDDELPDLAMSFPGSSDDSTDTGDLSSGSSDGFLSNNMVDAILADETLDDDTVEALLTLTKSPSKKPSKSSRAKGSHPAVKGSPTAGRKNAPCATKGSPPPYCKKCGKIHYSSKYPICKRCGNNHPPSKVTKSSAKTKTKATTSLRTNSAVPAAPKKPQPRYNPGEFPTAGLQPRFNSDTGSRKQPYTARGSIIPGALYEAVGSGKGRKNSLEKHIRGGLEIPPYRATRASPRRPSFSPLVPGGVDSSPLEPAVPAIGHPHNTGRYGPRGSPPQTRPETPSPRSRRMRPDASSPRLAPHQTTPPSRSTRRLSHPRAPPPTPARRPQRSDTQTNAEQVRFRQPAILNPLTPRSFARELSRLQERLVLDPAEVNALRRGRRERTRRQARAMEGLGEGTGLGINLGPF